MTEPCNSCLFRSQCDILAEWCKLPTNKVLKLRPELVMRSLAVSPAVATRRQKNRDYARKRSIEDPAAIRAALARYRKKHMATVLKVNRRWYERHKDEINRKRREKRAALRANK